MKKISLAAATAALLATSAMGQTGGAGQAAAPGLSTAPAAAAKSGPATGQAPASGNPLLAEWKGPNGGVPPFDKVRVADFKPALEAAMGANLKEVEAIANATTPPTFDNVILPMERSGRQLSRVYTLFGVWSGNVSTPDFQKVEEEMAPKLSAFQDSITQNPKLFARIDAVYNSPAKAKLTPEQQRLVWVYWNNFVQQGARLNATQKAELSKINQELAGLYTRFSQNELADEEDYALVLDNKAQLAGLPQSLVEAAAGEAERRKQPGKWIIANTRSSMEPFITYSTDRALREKGWRLWIMRGDNGGTHDNNAIVTQILGLRAKKAKLLGYPTYAHWHLADTMAKKPENAMALMMSVWTPAVAQVRRDVAEMQAIVDQEKGGFKIQPWDYRYYAEKVRKAKYDLDMAEVKPYLKLENVRDAMFWAAGQLYGYKFTPVTNVPLFNADMTAFDVTGADGAHVGMVYIDPFARAGKNSGAWMNEYRTQQGLERATPIVSNNYNFVKGAAGQPSLLSWDDATTMFHEFGHALHGLNSRVTYPTIAGTNVARDFVEFPSQFNEHWITTPEVLKFLVDANGKPIPPELVAKIHRAHTFNEGFSTVETQASAIVDMKLHLAGDTPVDPRAFEKATLAELGMPSEIVMRHRIPQFGYYGYLWAEVLDHDAFAAFTEAGGPYDKAVAKRFHDDILSVGNTVDPAVAFRNFRGRDPRPDALLKDHGFPVGGVQPGNN
jgi:peptidyl-dipeptidase Dcp